MTSATWSGTRRRSDQRGFTLLELLMALSLFGLMMGLAMPRAGSVRSSFFATEAARELANAVRSARDEAVRDRTTVALSPAPGRPDVLELRRLPAGSWDEGSLAVGAGDARGRVWDLPPIGSRELTGMLELDCPEPGLLFFANGSSSGGRVRVLDADGAVRHEFLVEAATGAFHVQ